MSKVLVVNDGKRERELLLVERLVVGRDPMCDLSHDDALLSRRHAEFAAIGDQVTVRDLGSRNGLFVNGTRAAERALRPGDIVQIGPLRVRYVTTEVAVSLVPDELDIDVTKVMSSPGAATSAEASAVQAVEDAEAAFIAGEADVEEEEDEEEEVTRVVHLPPDFDVASAAAAGDDPEAYEATMMVTAEEIGSGVRSSSSMAAEAFSSAATLRVPSSVVPPPAATTPTVMIPPPGTPGSGVVRNPAPRVEVRAPELPLAAVPATPMDAAAQAPAAPASVIGFLFVQLAALASVVFVAAAAPLLMFRGEGTLLEQRTLANLLRWPVLPIVIALATTYVVAMLVNRRITELMVAVRDEALTGADPGGAAGDPRK